MISIFWLATGVHVRDSKDTAWYWPVYLKDIK